MLASFILLERARDGTRVVGRRVARNTELSGFKLAAMMLPIPGHRAAPLANLRDRYEHETALLTESTWSAQGIVANIGFVALLGMLLYRKPVSRLLEGLSILNIFGIPVLAPWADSPCCSALLISP